MIKTRQNKRKNIWKGKKTPKRKTLGSCKVFKLAFCHVFTFLTTYHLIPVPHSSVGQPTLQEPGCPGCYLDLVAGGKMKPLSDLFFSPNLFFRQLTGFLFTSSQVPLELLKDSREGVQRFNFFLYLFSTSCRELLDSTLSDDRMDD